MTVSGGLKFTPAGDGPLPEPVKSVPVKAAPASDTTITIGTQDKCNDCTKAKVDTPVVKPVVTPVVKPAVTPVAPVITKK